MKNIGKSDCAVVLGVPLFRGTAAEALDVIFEMVARGEGGNVLVTMNVDFAVNAHHALSFVPRNQPLLDLMRRSPLVTADGMPILLLAKLIGTPLAERVTGADMVPDIARRAAACGARLYILGGNAGNNVSAMEILAERYPGVVFAGCETPFVKLDATAECEAENLALCGRINAARPDVLFVCLGNPKQELWSAKYAARLNAPVIIGVGGTFNFISGDVRRAPMWMQKSGLEWIYRIIQEPRRLLKRYMVGLVKFGCTAASCIFAAWLGRLFGRPSGAVWKNRGVREASDALVLDCAGLSRLDNPARLEIAARRVEADLAGKALKFEHLSRFAAFQLAAHRLSR